MAGIKLLRDVGFLVHGGWIMNKGSRRIGKDEKTSRKQNKKICGEVKTVFSAFTALSIFLFFLFFPFQSERSILFGPFRLWNWFTDSVLFVFSFKIQFPVWFWFVPYIEKKTEEIYALQSLCLLHRS